MCFGGPEIEIPDPVQADPDEEILELTASADDIARRRALLARRRRGQQTLSIDPATGGPSAISDTGLSI